MVHMHVCVCHRCIHMCTLIVLYLYVISMKPACDIQRHACGMQVICIIIINSLHMHNQYATCVKQGTHNACMQHTCNMSQIHAYYMQNACRILYQHACYPLLCACNMHVTGATFRIGRAIWYFIILSLLYIYNNTQYMYIQYNIIYYVYNYNAFILILSSNSSIAVNRLHTCNLHTLHKPQHHELKKAAVSCQNI